MGTINTVLTTVSAPPDLPHGPPRHPHAVRSFPEVAWPCQTSFRDKLRSAVRRFAREAHAAQLPCHFSIVNYLHT